MNDIIQKIFMSIEHEIEPFVDFIKNEVFYSCSCCGTKHLRHDRRRENKRILTLLHNNKLSIESAEKLIILIKKGNADFEENNIVFDMLEDNKISFEEACKLLKAVNQ